MNAKTLARSALLILVAGSLAWFGFQQSRQSHVRMEPGQETSRDHDHVVMTYFTTNVRCTSCRKIEALVRENAEKHHADAIADGRLVFQVINTDSPGMGHYVAEYELAFKTVIISHRKGGREVEWKNMSDVWEHMDEPPAFHAYLETALTPWLAP